MAIKILVGGSLEDHAVVKYALSSTMPDAVVEVAADGFRTLELARRTRPDLVVLDPAVSPISGPQLVARLREEAPATVVVCWTAEGDVEEATELLLAGSAGYLLKENSPGDLVRHLTAALDGGVVIAPPVAAELLPRFAQAVVREAELTRALAETTMQLQEIAGTKDEIMANVNHELRTPVTIVKGIAHLLKSGRLSEDDQELFVKRMDAAVDKLTGTVEDMLSVADLGRGRLTLVPKTLQMDVLTHEVCDRVADLFPEITIDRFVQPSLQVLADLARLGEAMEQIVDNGCRFSPSGGRVEVTLKRVAEGVMFSVTDSGDGLARKLVNKAFREPFVTGEDVLRKEKAGLGLGLHLARQLIVMHGGIMWADPLPSGGSRVAFCIPEHSALLVTFPPPAADDTNGNGWASADGGATAPEPGSPDDEAEALLRRLLKE
ncbi:MAG TPA: hybrid sensor histidine kinase/response regulator [Actinomycetota bacterium]|nr:hybrid sensor histidine kinase/response regulator [Actinomycetota bacterium]